MLDPATGDSTNADMSAMPLKNVSDKTGKAPKHRIGSASDARQLVQWLLQSNKDRSRYNAKIQGSFDGNAPFDPQTLRNAAQAYRTNVNWMEMKAARSAALVPFYDLFTGSKYYCEVVLEHQDPDQADDMSRWATMAFDKMLRSYDGFDYKMQAMLTDMVGFGKGFLMWEDNVDWHFNHRPHYRVYVPDGTEPYAQKAEVIVVRKPFSVTELWGYIKDKDAAVAAGWNVDETVRAILSAVPEDEYNGGLDGISYELVQQRMKDKDLYTGTRCKTVQVATLFVREFNGSITRLMVSEWQVPGENDRPIGYMYEKPKEYDSMREAIACFFMETLDGTWNGASGLGRDIFAAMESKNRLRCQAQDNAFLRAGVTLQAKSAGALQNTELVSVGVLNILPPDYEVQQGTILGDVEGLLAMDRSIDLLISRNTGIYQQRQMKESGNPVSATQATLDAQNEAKLGNSGVNRFYGQLDWFYREIFRRAMLPNLPDRGGCKAAKEFRTFCKEKGIPDEVLKKAHVTAWRNFGNGSMFLRQQSVASLFPMLQMFPERGRMEFMADVVAAYADQHAVQRWVRPDRTGTPTDQEALAVMENAILKQGSPVVITDTNNHEIHARIHIAAILSAFGAGKQGANPGDIYDFANAAGAHAQAHVNKLSADKLKRQVAAEYQRQLSEIARLTDELGAQLGKIKEEMDAQRQAQMEAQQNANPEMQIKAAEAQQKMQIQQAKAEQSLSTKERKFQQDSAQKAAKTKQELAIKDLQTAQELRANKLKADQELQLQKEKARNEKEAQSKKAKAK